MLLGRVQRGGWGGKIDTQGGRLGSHNIKGDHNGRWLGPWRSRVFGEGAWLSRITFKRGEIPLTCHTLLTTQPSRGGRDSWHNERVPKGKNPPGGHGARGRECVGDGKGKDC